AAGGQAARVGLPVADQQPAREVLWTSAKRLSAQPQALRQPSLRFASPFHQSFVRLERARLSPFRCPGWRVGLSCRHIEYAQKASGLAIVRGLAWASTCSTMNILGDAPRDTPDLRWRCRPRREGDASAL